MTQVHLTSEDGTLYVTNASLTPAGKEWHSDPLADSILVVHHITGDYDTIKWPSPNPDHLRSALYDMRETGQIDDVRQVTLPDDTIFLID